VLKEYNASVALIALSENIDSSFLNRSLVFIKRSEHPDDPWSGHVAFPGGGFEAIDKDGKSTSIRECKEEVGVDLLKSDYQHFVSELIPLKYFKGSRLSLKSYLFFSSQRPLFFDVAEVSDIFEVPVKDFFVVSYYEKKMLTSIESPQLVFTPKDSKYFIWGLTLAILLDYISRRYPNEIKSLPFLQEYHIKKNEYLSFFSTEKFSN
jgi:8-oxo-dGTP pyrophosphatase MutT (NUDIX family)